MFALDLLIGFIGGVVLLIPILGIIIFLVLLFIPGFVGGRKAGSVGAALLAALILTVIYAVINVLIIFAIIETLKSAPFVGELVGNLLNLVGGYKAVLAVAAVIVGAIPKFFGALIGGATAKK